MNETFTMRHAWRGLIGEGFFTSIVTLFPAYFVSSYFAHWQEKALADVAVQTAENAEQIQSALSSADLPGMIWLAFGGLFLFWLVSAVGRTIIGLITVDDTGITVRRGSFKAHEIRIDFSEIDCLFIRKIGIDGLVGVGGLGIRFNDAEGDLLVITGLPNAEKLAEEIEKRRTLTQGEAS